MQIRTGIFACFAIALLALPQWCIADTPDKEGLKRDTWYFLGYQWVTIGLLYAAPEGVSGWTEEQKGEYSLSHWWDNASHPKIDSDDFYINYLLHPYWGASYFVRAQERGYSEMGSFWYAVALSSAYEFGAEAIFEEPSIQDLIVTPVFGALVGKYFMQVRGNIREREAELGHRSTKDKWLWVLTDPLGALNGRMDKLFGRETKFALRPYRRSSRPEARASFETMRLEEDTVYGLEFEFRW